MKTWGAMAVAFHLAGVVAGCGGRPPAQEAVPGPVTGEYQIRVDRPDGTPFEAAMWLADDTVVVVPRTAACRPEEGRFFPSRYVVLCDGVQLSIDRFASGAPKVTARIEGTRAVTRRQCVAWTVVNGRQVCAQYQDVVTYERQVTTGRVIVNRGAAP